MADLSKIRNDKLENNIRKFLKNSDITHMDFILLNINLMKHILNVLQTIFKTPQGFSKALDDSGMKVEDQFIATNNIKSIINLILELDEYE